MHRLLSSFQNPIFWFAARINIYAISLTTLWTPISAVLLPQRVADITPQSLHDSALGALFFVGIGIAAVTQPIAGRISDVIYISDRRRPFILVGTAFDLLFLSIFWWSPNLGWLFLAYILLQISSNFAQAAFQALIPDLIGPQDRGLASGVLNGYNIVGSIIGLGGVGALLGGGLGQGATLLFISAILIIGAAASAVWVPQVPPLPADRRAHNLADLVDLKAIAAAFKIDFRVHRLFVLATATRFLFLLGLYPLQHFVLYFLEDRYHLQRAAATVSFAFIGLILIGAVSAGVAGVASDRLGRVGTSVFGILFSVAGIAWLSSSPSLAISIGAGFMLAIGIGFFQATNWALLADHIPSGQGARFFGLANIATAGASALAGAFGPLISYLGIVFPKSNFEIAFGIGGAIALTSLLPLWRLVVEQRRRQYTG